jgi:hypothetical protein
MDIAGAKALKRRLGPDLTDDSPSASVDVPEDAPPVFHWVGISNAPSEASAAGENDELAGESVSLFRRLGLSFG